MVASQLYIFIFCFAVFFLKTLSENFGEDSSIFSQHAGFEILDLSKLNSSRANPSNPLVYYVELASSLALVCPLSLNQSKRDIYWFRQAYDIAVNDFDVKLIGIEKKNRVFINSHNILMIRGFVFLDTAIYFCSASKTNWKEDGSIVKVYLIAIVSNLKREHIYNTSKMHGFANIVSKLKNVNPLEFKDPNSYLSFFWEWQNWSDCSDCETNNASIRNRFGDCFVRASNNVQNNKELALLSKSTAKWPCGLYTHFRNLSGDFIDKRFKDLVQYENCVVNLTVCENIRQRKVVLNCFLNFYINIYFLVYTIH
jgi:hypothetical protein